MSLPISVWLSAIVMFVFTAYSAWHNPVLWFQCLVVVIFIASFARLTYYLIEKR